jgi:hypothetical protein
MFHDSPAKLASKRTTETFQGLPVWLVTLQVHNQECDDFDTVWRIRWPSQEAPDLPSVMTHWSRYPRQFQLAGYMHKAGFQPAPNPT